MCFCDGKYFLITNKSNGEKHLIDGDENLHAFFNGFYSLPLLFHRYLKREQVRFKDNFYIISSNFHPECERVKRDLIKMRGIREPELELKIGRCPDKYRHLLPPERQ